MIPSRQGEGGRGWQTLHGMLTVRVKLTRGRQPAGGILLRQGFPSSTEHCKIQYSGIFPTDHTFHARRRTHAGAHCTLQMLRAAYCSFSRRNSSCLFRMRMDKGGGGTQFLFQFRVGIHYIWVTYCTQAYGKASLYKYMCA